MNNGRTTMPQSLQETQKNVLKAVNIFLVLLTCLWFLPLYNKGIDLTDTSFYLVNYKYFFDPSVNVGGVGIYFTNLVGGILYHLLPSHQLLILNLVSAFCYTVSGYLIYYILKGFISHTLLLITTFGCSLLSLSYIHCFNYNTTSMFLLTLAIFLLTEGLFQNKESCIAASGFVSVVNIFFRIPNVLHLCIALGGVLYCYDRNGNMWRDVIRPALVYIGGCLAGAAVSGILLFSTLGADPIISYIEETFLTMTASSGGHSSSSMFRKLASQIANGILLWWQYAPVLLLIILVSFVLCVVIKRYRKAIFCCSGIAALTYGFYVKHATEITTEMSSSNKDIKNTFCFILLALMGLSFIGIFVFFKNNRKFSYLCLITFMLELVITIGTDTGALYNTVFLYLPVGMLCCLLYQYYLLFREKQVAADLTASTGVVLTAFSVMLLLYSGFYRGTTYVYRDSAYNELTVACDDAPLKGMRTSAERAELISLIREQLESYGESALITFGDCNIATVVTDMKPFFTNAWPDLRSFSEESYSEQLEQCRETGEYPVILFSKTTMLTYTGRLDGKEQILRDFIDENRYELVYDDELISLYVPTAE